MSLFDSGVQSIEDWYEILGWERLPNFGHFHTEGSIESFEKNYFKCNEISSLYKNIVQTIKNNGFNAANIRIMGNPGSGKTTFLYALKELSKKERNLLNDFTFYIFHINRTDDENFESTYRKEITYNIEKAWKQYYLECGLSDEFTRITQQGKNRKERINRLSEMFLEEKNNFRKTLVFIIDDVDLLSGDHVAAVAKIVMRNLEQASVKKWLVLRDVTFDEYAGETKANIEQFYPDPYAFPLISLHDLVVHRIKISSPNMAKREAIKFPFSKKLCDEIVMPLCSGNLREGLSMLKSFLEESLPKKITSSNNQEFIEKYIENTAVNTLIKAQKLINLHSKLFRCAIYPLAIDILQCANYHTAYEIIFGSVNDCVVARDYSSGKNISGDHSIVKVRKDDFVRVLNQLIDHNMISHDKTNNRLTINERGKLHASFAVRSKYIKHCKKLSQSILDDTTYWALAEKTINHEKIVSTYLRWTLA